MAVDHRKYLEEVLLNVKSISSDIPAHRSAFKQGYSFSRLPFEEQLQIWDHVWHHAHHFRGQLHAYFFLEEATKKKEHHAAIWATSMAWQELVNDWPLCDSLSKVNTKVLESFPGDVYTVLAAWNKDADLWKRRQSVVSLLYYSRTKKEHLPYSKITSLLTPLLTDKEYYVQKGVGWTLRELYNVYPTETMAFVTKHIKSISPIAFTTSIEKMSMVEKEALNGLRKK